MSLPTLAKGDILFYFFESLLSILTSCPSHGPKMFSFSSRKMLCEYHRWSCSFSLFTLIKEGDAAIIQS